MTTTANVDLAIAGGGASGLLVALHALKRRPGCRIAIVELQRVLGSGVAYATRHGEHLLNVPAGRMSVDEDVPDDFVAYLHSRTDLDLPGAGPLSGRFMPRRLFHDYLAARFEAATAGASVEHVRAVAVGRDPGTGNVALDSGGHLRAGALVLATGNQAKRLPFHATPGAMPRICAAWDYDAVRAVPVEADVAIAGTGLSMVDAVLSLHARGHRGAIVALSRHALLPLAHAAPGEWPVDVQALSDLPLRARMRRLRGLAADAGRDGVPWQWLMQGLRPYGVRLWRSMTDADRARFLRHAARYWDVHRHRIAPQAAMVVQSLLDSGQLTVAAARLESVRDDAGRLRVAARCRNGELREWSVDRAINATGIELRLARTANPLLQGLRDAGLAVAGPAGLGVDVDADGAVRDAQGVAHRNLFAIGSLRVGAEWESIAIPELRLQAAGIAGRFAAA